MAGQNQPVDLPGDRIGILMQPSWLVAWSSNFYNDPVRRGLWIREHLLGQPVPPVPVGVVIVLPDDPQQTLRQRMQITKERRAGSATRRSTTWDSRLKRSITSVVPANMKSLSTWKPRQLTKLTRPANTKRARSAQRSYPSIIQLPLETTGNVFASGDPKLNGPVKGPAEMIRKLAESNRVRDRSSSATSSATSWAATRHPVMRPRLQEADRVYVAKAAAASKSWSCRC